MSNNCLFKINSLNKTNLYNENIKKVQLIIQNEPKNNDFLGLTNYLKSKCDEIKSLYITFTSFINDSNFTINENDLKNYLAVVLLYFEANTRKAGLYKYGTLEVDNFDFNFNQLKTFTDEELKIVKFLNTLNISNKNCLLLYKRVLESLLVNLSYTLFYYKKEFLLYSNKAVELGSIKAKNDLIRYHLRYDSNYLDAKKHFLSSLNDLKTFPIKDEDLDIKYSIISSILYIFEYLINSCNYEEGKTLIDYINKSINENEINKNTLKEIKDLLNDFSNTIVYLLKTESECNINEEKLKSYINENVLKTMTNETKVFIYTSIVIEETFKDDIVTTTLDYSFFLTSIWKCIEKLMYKISYNYLVYMNKNHDEEFLENFKNTERIVNNSNKFTIESFLKIIANQSSKDKYIINDNFYKYISDGATIFNKEFCQAFVNKTIEIKKFRNKSSHKSRISKEFALSAKKMIFEELKYIEVLQIFSLKKNIVER